MRHTNPFSLLFLLPGFCRSQGHGWLEPFQAVTEQVASHTKNGYFRINLEDYDD